MKFTGNYFIGYGEYVLCEGKAEKGIITELGSCGLTHKESDSLIGCSVDVLSDITYYNDNFQIVDVEGNFLGR